jgi:hypothetical protein
MDELDSAARAAVTDYATIQRDLWGPFVDTLDRARQDGRIAEVVVPALADDTAAGKLFGELTHRDVETLTQQPSKVWQRAGVITAMWQEMQRRKQLPQRPSATVLTFTRSRAPAGQS